MHFCDEHVCMMYDLEYGCLYDFVIAMIPCYHDQVVAFVWDEWYDSVSHARVFFYVHMGLALFLFNCRYVCV